MKYMGSKEKLLGNGLGDLLVERARSASRVVDLFSGAASVAWYAAEHTKLPVLAVDLQHYSKALAESVLARTKPLGESVLEESWLRPAERRLHRSKVWRRAVTLDSDELTAATVSEARKLCEHPSSIGPIWSAYGGYYYSPAQAIAFDYLRDSLPEDLTHRSLCLGVLIIAASRCAAAPGHTAQPFRPTATALRYIEAAWRRDPVATARKELPGLAKRSAQTRGRALVADATEVAASLEPSDLVIVDPPYSTAQYSRFYHVLETLARARCGPVEGAGRYPRLTERPQSDFCKRATSRKAVKSLLQVLASSGASVIMTFPQHGASNGLEGEELVDMAGKWFRVDVKVASTQFSTLGGNGRHRASRRRAFELVLSLTPQGR